MFEGDAADHWWVKSAIRERPIGNSESGVFRRHQGTGGEEHGSPSRNEQSELVYTWMIGGFHGFRAPIPKYEIITHSKKQGARGPEPRWIVTGGRTNSKVRKRASGDGGAGGFVGADFDGAEDEVFESADKKGGVSDRGHHAITLDPGFFGVEAAVDIDFVKRFDVFGDEGDRNDHGFLDALVAECVEGFDEGGFEPFGRAHSALETENARFGPVGVAGGAEFVDKANRFVDVLWIGVPFFDEAHGDGVSAKDEMNPRGIRKLAEALADIVDEGLNVERVVVETFDGAFGQRVDRFAIDAAPFLEAAERRGVGVMRIERKEDEFIKTLGALKDGNGILGERLPVAHGGHSDGLDVRPNGFNEAHTLALGENADRRTAADHAVALRDGHTALFGDVTGQRTADEIERAKRDDVRVGKKVAEEGFDIGERVRSAELEEDDADAFFGVSHGIRSPQL